MSQESSLPTWQQIDQLLDEVLELETTEIPAFLERIGQGNKALRKELEAWLEAFHNSDKFIEVPPQAALNELFAAHRPLHKTGQMLGPYRLLGELGRGGMGIVYKAIRADDEYQKEVAIKLVWADPNNLPLIKRFKQERQILANLDHPNIARLLDGGTTDQGLPFVVMEFIEGKPITEYCQEHRLSITQRLELFRAVCGAVQYAHQSLVIHRDLKPSNILVTADGQVKLLDFGIAKLTKPDLNPDSGLIQDQTTNAHLMTPEYASPEQIQGEVITTASDVYSLGVVLHELLTGTSPYRLPTRSLPEIIRAVTEQEIIAPSQLIARHHTMATEFVAESSLARWRARLRGDLDTVVLTALSKEIHRRYRSAEQLSADLYRHLTHQPISARTPTLFYQFRKFARRRRAMLAATLLIFFSLVGGIVATSSQARRARAERAKAELNAQEARYQRAAAELSAAIARQQQSRAEASAQEANAQRRLAEAMTAEARKQQQLAEEARQRAEAGEASYRRLAYAAEMHLGTQYWDMANIGGLRRIINNQIPKPGEEDLRGFEWQYLRRLLQRNGEQLNLQHQSEVFATVFSPDGKIIATGHSANTDSIKLWAADSGLLLKTLGNGRALPWALAFSPDGQKLAGAFNDGSAKIWELGTGREVLFIRGHQSRMTAIAFSPDGTRFVTGSDDETAKVWETRTGQELLTIITGSGLVKAVAFSPDGKIIATGGVGSRTPGQNSLKVRLWQSSTGQELKAFDVTATWSLSFSPDGKVLATAADNQVKLWEVSSGQLRATLRGHSSRIRAVAIAPNHKYVASAAEDRTVKLWDIDAQEELATLKGHQAEVFSVAFSPEGQRLVTGGMDLTARVWDVQVATEVTRINPPRTLFNRAAYSPDGQHLAIVENFTLAVRDAVSGQKLSRCEGHQAAVTGFDFFPDGKEVATISEDRTLRIWETASGKEIAVLTGHTATPMAVSVASDGRRIVTSAQDQTARVWDVALRRELFILKGHTHPVISTVRFSPDGRHIVTGGYDKTVRVWDAQTGQEVMALSGQIKPVLCLAISPDGQWIAAGSADNTVKIWERASGKELNTLTGCAGQIRTLAFSPDGRRLATGSGDSLIRLWDPRRGQEMIALQDHHTSVNSVAFSPDGQILIAALVNGPVRIWRTAN
jgi:WD40 repeat protein/serine/threonine protein kinase/Skp family chaperone for outer membrane proteins